MSTATLTPADEGAQAAADLAPLLGHRPEVSVDESDVVPVLIWLTPADVRALLAQVVAA